MPLGDYLVGLAFFAGTAGGAALAAEIAVRRRLAHLAGAPRLLAFATIATAGLIVAHLLPGLVGGLSRWTALGVALLLAAIACRLPRVPPEPADRSPGGAPESGRLSWVIAGLAVAGLTLVSAAGMWVGSATPSIGIDTLTFHLPVVARWIQSGSLWQVHQFTPLLANGNYPQNGDVVFLSVVQPWRNDAFVKLVSPVFLALTAISVYAIARELRAARASAVLAGVLFASIPQVLLAVAEGAKTDPIMFATLGSGTLFLLRSFRNGRRSELIVAGLGLGVAFGTKWYALSSVAVVVLVWAVAWLVARRGVGPLVRRGAILAGLIAAAGGFWLVRNVIESGSPLYPVKVELLGATLFDAPRDYIRECGGFTILHYLGSPDVWTEYILPSYGDSYAVAGIVLVIGLAGGVALASVGRRRAASARPESGAVLAFGAAAILLALAYAATPYSAFGPEGEPILVGASTRYLLPALMACAVVFAWALGRFDRVRPLFELFALIAIADGLRRGSDVPRLALAGGAVLTVLVAASAYGLYRLRDRIWRPPIRGVMTAAAVVGLGLLVAIGHLRQLEFNDGRYAGIDPTLDWIIANAPAGARVGLAGVPDVDGISPVLPAFGPRLSNDVEYVGEFVDGQLREYETSAAFGEAAEAGNFDLLLIGKAGYSGCDVPGAERSEGSWAADRQFVKVAESERLELYEAPQAPAGMSRLNGEPSAATRSRASTRPGAPRGRSGSS